MPKSPAESLQGVIESGHFEEAPPLISLYGKYVAGRIQSAGTLEERLALTNEALDFLHDRLHLMRVMRAHLAAQLACVSRLSSYATLSADESHWTLEG